MLTADQSILEYKKGQAIPDRLTRVTHRHYLDYAGRMLAVYRGGIGGSRRELHRSIQNVLAGEPDCDRRRIASFCKLLDDAGEFDRDKKGQSAAMRLKVFALAAKYHPLVVEPDQIFERGEAETKRAIAVDLGQSWDEIDSALYADVIDRQRLLQFDGYESPEALLSHYNLSQLQAALYRARELVVEASEDFAAIVRYAKLARLLLDIRRIGERRYRIELTGPASILHETRRYGIQFARFVAALVSCRGWEMRARVTTPWGQPAIVRVSSADGYRSHIEAPAMFDSRVEAHLAEEWGDQRDGWRIERQAGILHEGQTTFVPDFLFRHDDGREALMEIVGFWTPEYLAAKRQTLKRFRHQRILLAVPTRTLRTDIEPGDEVIVYKTRIKPEDVVTALNRWSPVIE